MEYNDVDKQVLSLMEKINLKDLSINDALSFTSKLERHRDRNTVLSRNEY